MDSWAVDYGLLRGDRMLGEPFHYRDERNERGVEAVHGSSRSTSLYRRNGLQFLPFNTIYQLAVERDGGCLDLADSLLLVPDLVGFQLTGCEACPSARTRRRPGSSAWSRASGTTSSSSGSGSRHPCSPRSSTPASRSAACDPSVAADLGAPAGIEVVAVGSHDTASAVVAVPMRAESAAYISCGTWGLVGVELEHPVTTDAARLANFTNEGGVDGRVRFLHNVMGLWLLSESVRLWERDGERIDLPELLAAAASVTAPGRRCSMRTTRGFLAPGDLPGRIAEWCLDRGIAAPQGRAEFARSIIESLAEAFAEAVRDASILSGVDVETIHVVGGGALNGLLCQRTADRSGLPVLAGPVEATAIGNVLVQARAQGFAGGDLESLRALVASAFAPTRYEPAAG